MNEVKQEVKSFYNQVGWQLVGEDIYQNARYEDLRPVAREYIHRCHSRVSRHLSPNGQYLLDAGSGPVQYPEYLEYSQGYQRRVCADISITALKEARRRLGDHGLYVVTDVANLPFKADAFDGVVSLHTIHHLPEEEHLQAFGELHRVLNSGHQAVVVNGWSQSPLMDRFEPLIRFAQTLRYVRYRLTGRRPMLEDDDLDNTGLSEVAPVDSDDSANDGDRNTRKNGRKKGRRLRKGDASDAPKGTFTNKHDAAWVRSEVGKQMPVEILVWRSVTVRMTRALIHPILGGKLWLRLLYHLEERNPKYYGENGKYPLIVLKKS